MKKSVNILGIISSIGLLLFGLWMLQLMARILFSAGWNEGIIFLFLYGMIPIALGVYILFHLKKEDQIEQVKTRRVRK